MVILTPLRIGLWDPFQMAFLWLINGGDPWDDPPSRRIQFEKGKASQQGSSSSWWLFPHPIWKICSSNWIISQGIGVKIKKYLKPQPSYITNPDNALLREILQNYHRFALFHPPKRANLMTLAEANIEKQSTQKNVLDLFLWWLSKSQKTYWWFRRDWQKSVSTKPSHKIFVEAPIHLKVITVPDAPNVRNIYLHLDSFWSKCR